MGDPSLREAFRDYIFPPAPTGACNEWCAPLHLVERAVAGEAYAQHLRVEDFMVMAAVRRRGRPRLYLYKHSFTRRYLNVDAKGGTWRYVPGRYDRPGDQGTYVRCTNLRAAIDELRLWELPRFAGWSGADGGPG
jgi:hypothetical protein